MLELEMRFGRGVSFYKSPLSKSKFFQGNIEFSNNFYSRQEGNYFKNQDNRKLLSSVLGSKL